MNDLPEGFVLDSELPKPQSKKRNQPFIEGVGLGAAKRVLGAAELGLNVAQSLGADVKDLKQKIAMGQQEAELQGKGTGVKGFFAEVAGDPVTYIPGVGLAKLLAQGAFMGATSGTGREDSDLGDNAIGAGTGAVVSLGGSAAGKLIQKAARPVSNQLTQIGKAGIQKLEQAGVPLTAAQKTGSKALAALESVFSTIPMTSGSQNKIFDKQRQAFTQAALKEAGITADDAGRATIEKAQKAFTKEYADITANNNLVVDDSLLQNVANIYGEATSGRLGQDAANLVKSVAQDIYNSGNQISGTVYQKTRSLLTQKANSAKDAFDSGLMKQLRNELDSAFERSLPQAQKGVMANINKRYEAFKAIKDSMETLGGAGGNIAPSTLYQKVRTGSRLSDLADAGQNTLNQKIPDSGTAQRMLLQNALTGTGVGLAGYGATSDSGIAPWATAAGLALAGPKAAQLAYNSNIGQKYLTEGTPKAVQFAAEFAARKLPKSVASGVTLNRANAPQQAMEQVPVDSELPEGFVIDEQNIQYEPMSYTAPQSSNQFFDAVKMAESSGNPNAKATTSSASGLYQFTDQTWKDSVAKWGKKYGITEAMKNNPQAQEAMVRELAADNARILTNKLKREPNVADMYVAHVFGAGSGAKLINSLGSNKIAFQIMPPKDVYANMPIFFEGEYKNKKFIPRKPRTVEQVYSLLGNKVT